MPVTPRPFQTECPTGDDPTNTNLTRDFLWQSTGDRGTLSNATEIESEREEDHGERTAKGQQGSQEAKSGWAQRARVCVQTIAGQERSDTSPAQKENLAGQSELISKLADGTKQ
jgi:hypothetical protein